MKQSYQGPENELTGMIIGCAIEVHRHFGCSLKETAYEAALSWELQQKGLKVERQKACPVFYKGMDLSQEDEHPRRIDLLVEGKVVVECKALPSNDYVFKAQCLTYLKMLQLRVGLVLNFGLPTMKAGIQHVINETKEEYLDRLKREHPNVYQAVLEEEEEGERAPLDRAQANLQNELRVSNSSSSSVSAPQACQHDDDQRRLLAETGDMEQQRIDEISNIQKGDET